MYHPYTIFGIYRHFIHFEGHSQTKPFTGPKRPCAHLFLGLGPLRVDPPACSASALIVVLTLFIAVCMLSLFLEAGPSETARAWEGSGVGDGVGVRVRGQRLG